MSATDKEISEGVSTVQAVAARLSGPMTVWVLLNHTSDDDYIYVYLNEASARAAMLEQVIEAGEENKFDTSEYEDEIKNGASNVWLEDSNEDFGIGEYEVQP